MYSRFLARLIVETQSSLSSSWSTTKLTRNYTNKSQGSPAPSGCAFHEPQVNVQRSIGSCPINHGSTHMAMPLGTSNDTTSLESCLPFERLPSKRGLPLVGNLFDLLKAGGSSYMHRFCDTRHRELGPIFREKLGELDIVFISDADLIQKVYTNDGKFPRHMVPEPWILYNQDKGIQRGLFFMDGQEWSDRRRALNKVFLMPQIVNQYTPVFNEVITDILDGYEHSMQCTGQSNELNMVDLEKQLYNWSIESLGAMIFGRRLGCIASKADRASQNLSIHEFVDCVQSIFVESANMQLIPPKLAYKLKLAVWKRFSKAAGRALELAFDYVNENAERTSKEGEEGIIQLLQREGHMELDEISRIVVDLFIAAADTTSHATQWALYLLARNKNIQNELYNQIERVTGGEDVQEKHLPSLGYVKGVIKESLRLYPVAPFLTRYLSHDLNLGGYHVPKGQLVVVSLYTTGRLEKYFENAHKFDPSRWVRDEETGRHQVWNSYACLPFGLGVRSCIGRRVAEVQMQFLISRLVQRFTIQQIKDEEIDIKLRMITTPEKTIDLSLSKRNANSKEC